MAKKKKRIRRFKSVENWRLLKIGDKIDVKSGPYWLNKETKEKVSMGERGKFSVNKVIKEGLVCRGEEGWAFIYMGKTKTCKTTGIHLRTHKIRQYI